MRALRVIIIEIQYTELNISKDKNENTDETF